MAEDYFAARKMTPPEAEVAAAEPERLMQIDPMSGLMGGWLGTHGYTHISGDESGTGYWQDDINVRNSPDHDDRNYYDPTRKTVDQLIAEGIPQQFADQYWDDQFYQTVGNVVSKYGEQYADAAIRAVDADRRRTLNPQDHQAWRDYFGAWNEIPKPDRGNLWSGSAGIVRNVTHGLRHLLTENPASMAAIGGMLAPYLSGAGTAGAGATAGLSAADAVGLAQMAADAGLTGAAAEAFVASGGALGSTAAAGTGMFGNLMQGATRGAIQGGLPGLLQGDIGAALQGALRGGATGGATAGVQGLFDSGMEWLNTADAPALPDEASMAPFTRASYDPLTDVDAGMRAMRELGLAPQELITPMQVEGAPTYTPADQIARQSMVNAGLGAAGLGAGNELVSEPEGSEPAPAQGPTDLVQEPTPDAPLTGKQYIDMAKKVNSLYNQIAGQDVPEFVMPQRPDGMSDEEYNQLLSNEAIDYLGLDADDMRDAGFEPGTQEYLDYILEQADQLIEAAFGGDPSALLEGESIESLQAALRDLTESEMESLARALHLRGMLGSQSFSDEAVDPFTGEAQDLGTRPGESAQSARAGAMRGYAEFIKRAARLSGPESRMAIRGMLNRSLSPFDMDKTSVEGNLKRLLDGMFASGSVGDDPEAAVSGAVATPAGGMLGNKFFAQKQDRSPREIAAAMARQIMEEKRRRGQKADMNDPDLWREVFERMDIEQPGITDELRRIGT